MNRSSDARETGAHRQCGVALSPSRRLYLAGECAPPGAYRQVDGPYRRITLMDGERLPASLDGHVAYYVRVCTWSEKIAPKSEEN